MTLQHTIGHAVTQGDRNAAAAALGYKDYDDATDYRLTGAQDREVAALVQAFARHRIEAQAALLEALTQIVEFGCSKEREAAARTAIANATGAA